MVFAMDATGGQDDNASTDFLDTSIEMVFRGTTVVLGIAVPVVRVHPRDIDDELTASFLHAMKQRLVERLSQQNERCIFPPALATTLKLQAMAVRTGSLNGNPLQYLAPGDLSTLLGPG